MSNKQFHLSRPFKIAFSKGLDCFNPFQYVKPQIFQSLRASVLPSSLPLKRQRKTAFRKLTESVTDKI